ncbi:hypothetical protein [Neisseria dentiae]|uniref:EVE domain-containing protein n=1 Tax=Neisseria dentiae TaxID=194197 RepID=A0A1X3D1Z0_9NEIS|nr:hypothetical protein [Neisseria dentiae]MCQ9326577.1 hypothetical protein [Neisseria dentiae]OSI13785.1 hypothetical protein BWD09_12530 [Neisseria dentiae]QMT45417.1 hypothetical protein H3L92_00825 [Neisseria dentiae]STZ51205.1 Uncharacterised protein [Neisseria dentiae]
MAINFLDSLSNEFVERNQEKTTFSIRLSIKEDLILQEVADSFEFSRQELIHRLITEQIIEPWKQRHKEQAEEELVIEETKSVNYFLLNTNKINDVDDHKWMLSNGVAAAFEDGYKEKIQKFRKGDWIFLYESGQGIVALGKASGVLEKTEHYGRADKTFFQKLDDFQVLPKPIKASEVKRILSRSFPFAATLSRITDGEKILDEIEKKE